MTDWIVFVWSPSVSSISSALLCFCSAGPAGTLGRLTVRLSEAIKVDAISIEHGARELLLNNGISALKDFTVVGERGLLLRILLL